SAKEEFFLAQAKSAAAPALGTIASRPALRSRPSLPLFRRASQRALNETVDRIAPELALVNAREDLRIAVGKPRIHRQHLEIVLGVTKLELRAGGADVEMR